mgnify:CR=1 FL=1
MSDPTVILPWYAYHGSPKCNFAYQCAAFTDQMSCGHQGISLVSYLKNLQSNELSTRGAVCSTPWSYHVFKPWANYHSYLHNVPWSLLPPPTKTQKQKHKKQRCEECTHAVLCSVYLVNIIPYHWTVFFCEGYYWTVALPKRWLAYFIY